jgi:hypothetical protein
LLGLLSEREDFLCRDETLFFIDSASDANVFFAVTMFHLGDECSNGIFGFLGCPLGKRALQRGNARAVSAVTVRPEDGHGVYSGSVMRAGASWVKHSADGLQRRRNAGAAGEEEDLLCGAEAAADVEAEMGAAELNGVAYAEAAEVGRDFAAVHSADEEAELAVLEVELFGRGGWRWERGVVPCDLDLGLFDLDGPEAVLPCLGENGAVGVSIMLVARSGEEGAPAEGVFEVVLGADGEDEGCW